MSDPQSGPPFPPATTHLTDILTIRSPARWYLLRELASGDQYMVTGLVERVGLTPDATFKNFAVLRSAGIVLQGRNRLYTLARQFLADKTERIFNSTACCG